MMVRWAEACTDVFPLFINEKGRCAVQKKSINIADVRMVGTSAGET